MMINFNNFGKGLIWKTVAVAGVLAFMLAGQVSEASPFKVVLKNL